MAMILSFFEGDGSEYSGSAAWDFNLNGLNETRPPRIECSRSRHAYAAFTKFSHVPFQQIRRSSSNTIQRRSILRVE